MRGILQQARLGQGVQPDRRTGAELPEPAERKVWETSKWVRMSLDAADFVVIATDESGIVRYCSGGIRKYFGYEPAQRIGGPLLDLFSREELARRADELSRKLDRHIDPGFDVFTAEAATGHSHERD